MEKRYLGQSKTRYILPLQVPVPKLPTDLGVLLKAGLPGGGGQGRGHQVGRVAGLGPEQPAESQ